MATNHYSIFPQQPDVPLPPAYARQVSYDSSQTYTATTYEKTSVRSPLSDVDSLKVNQKNEEETSTGKHRVSLLICLLHTRIYIRVLAVLIMIVSISLILTAVVSFEKAKKMPGHPLDSVPKPAPITDHPCVVFTGVAAMNLVISCSILVLSCMSSKFRKSNEVMSAIFAIISAVGFATSMGACFFLNKESQVKNDLWKWSCGNHKKGVVSDVIDFNLVCHAVKYSWNLGLVQASLELFTFIISLLSFVLLKYSNLVRFGAIGKVF